ncbi:MAG: STAS domain-containing protein [Deferribacteres bacterium]|nr:STAS domain-containing protein [candidate division KSB1 bacterium]MCB9501835.1 STAS domain-containing protein [Deferribacteres bacterium]
MKLKTEMMDDVAVVSLDGKLMGGPPASDVIRNEVYSLLNQNTKKIVFDLEKVTRMNSSGLGILISNLTSIKSKGGDLKLAALNENMKGIMVMTKLNTIFEISTTAEEAVKSF